MSIGTAGSVAVLLICLGLGLALEEWMIRRRRRK